MRTPLECLDASQSNRRSLLTRARFEESADYVQSLARGLEVIRAFGQERPSPTLSEVAQATGLARAVVRRSLLTLQHLGYVDQKERQFILTPRVLELGYPYLSSLALPDLAQPFMEAVSRRVGESCSMAVLDDTEIVYVARVPVRRILAVSLSVGARLPAFAASMGRVLLGGLPDDALDAWLARAPTEPLTPHTITQKGALRAEILRVRAQGYAVVVQELELGLCSVAVPLRDRQGRTIAALNVGMPFRTGARARATQEILPALREAAKSIEGALVAAPTPAAAGGA